MLAPHAPRRHALGFTDHDRDLAFDGTTFEAATGFTATEIKDAVGLSVDNLEVSSALSSDRLNEDDLAAGLYDDAAVEIWRVNWADTDQRVLMRSGSLGEVRRSGPAFTAEVRGLAHYLQQPKGRLFQYGCDADLGDARCGVDLDDPAFRGTGTVVAASSPRLFTASGLGSFAADWFTRGLVTFTSGANAGRAQEVSATRSPAPRPPSSCGSPWRIAIAPGDTFTVTAGCDKQLRHLPGQVRQRRQLPRLPAHARQRLRRRHRPPRRYQPRAVMSKPTALKFCVPGGRVVRAERGSVATTQTSRGLSRI